MERKEACISFGWGNRREREYWEDPGVDGRIILGRIFRKWMWGYGLDGLAEDRDRWQAI
jgi:hypothetical protein